VKDAGISLSPLDPMWVITQIVLAQEHSDAGPGARSLPFLSIRVRFSVIVLSLATWGLYLCW